MRRSLATILLVASLLTGATALAAGGRKLQEYQEVQQPELQDEAQPRGRRRLSTWQEADPLTPEPRVPWMFIGLAAMLVALATPFAWSAYQRTSKELSEANAFAGQAPRRTRTKD
jgi:hypothetical protein